MHDSHSSTDRAAILGTDGQVGQAIVTDEDFYRVLANVTAAVTESLVLETALERLGEVVVPRLADWCAIHLSDGQDIELALLAHPDPARRAAALDSDERYGPRIDDEHGVARVLRTGEPELHVGIHPDNVRAHARDEIHAATLAAMNITAAALVPLTRRGRVAGVLTLVAEGGRTFDSTTIRLAEEIGRRAAVAIENSQLFEATEHARSEMAVTQGTLNRLLQLSPTLSFATDEVGAAAMAARAARDLFGGQAASVWRFIGDEMELVARHPEQAHLVAGRRIPLSDFPGFRDEVSLGIPSFVADIAADYPELRERAARIDTTSIVRLPLLTGDGLAGFITVSWAERREQPSQAQLALAQRFADLAALGIEDARRRRAEHDRRLLHLQLEASLMPTPRISEGRMDVRSRYVSGEEGLMLAGDFLDAYELPDGSVRAIVGDVVGRGPDAAGRAASLRSSWRALTAAGLPQLEVVGVLERLALDGPDVDQFVTVCAIEIGAADDRLSIVCAGHPPPIVVRDDSVHEIVVDVAPPLGLGARAPQAATEVGLTGNWTLMLYTDGLVEGRIGPNDPERFGTERLLRWLDSNASPELVDRQLDALLDHVRTLHGAPFSDDTAVLVLAPPRR